MRSPIVTLPDAFLKSCSIVNFVARLDNFMITSHFFGNLKFIGVRYKKRVKFSSVGLIKTYMSQHPYTITIL